jgi:predicted GNAT family acetyltransferase
MTVTHNVAAQRYELPVEHGLAIAVYRQQGDTRVFTHTEVPPEDEGKGIGAQIVKAALEDTLKQGFRIIPACSFVAAYVRRHPEFGEDRP